MPARNKKLTLEQRVSAIEWEAHAEKLAHFLRDTPGYPVLEPAAVVQLFDEVESALLDLRRTFEDRSDGPEQAAPPRPASDFGGRAPDRN